MGRFLLLGKSALSASRTQCVIALGVLHTFFVSLAGKTIFIERF